MRAMILVGSICLVFGTGSTLGENGGILGCPEDGFHSTREDRIRRKEITGRIVGGEQLVYAKSKRPL